jgi:hypothetical protein
MGHCIQVKLNLLIQFSEAVMTQKQNWKSTWRQVVTLNWGERILDINGYKRTAT